MTKTAKKVLVAVVLAALGALAGRVAEWGWDYYFKPFSLEVDAYYRSSNGQKELARGAKIDLGIPAVESRTTDDRGKAYWHDLEPHPTRKTSISAVFLRYHLVHGPDVSIRRRWGAIEIVLEPDAIANAPETNLLPKVSRVYRSGPKPSGAGKDFSPWWSQCSDEPPANGYLIESEHFELVGDRQCGAWSECKKVSQTPTKVCYEFRMQGHDEWTGPLHGLIPSGNPGQALSEGILTVVWAPDRAKQ
jgi:hypothetical protein